MDSRAADDGTFFRPDVLLADEYFRAVRRKAVLGPEERLLFALLKDAVACFQRYIHARTEKERKLFCDAEQWLLKRGDHWLFSFEGICDVFGLDPDYVRRGLLEWKAKRVGGGPSRRKT